MQEVLKSGNLMGRLYALNLADQMGGDAQPLLEEIEKLSKKEIAAGDYDYDVRAAKRLFEILR